MKKGVLRHLFSLCDRRLAEIKAQVIDDEGDAGQTPGDGVNGIDIKDVPAKGQRRDFQERHADDAPEDQHDDHRDKGTSRAAHDGRHGMRKGEQEIEERADPGSGHAEGDHLRCGVKERNELRREQKDDDTDHLRDDHGTEQAEACPALRAFRLLCTDVLRNEGGCRHVEADDGHEGEALDLGISAAARHRHAAEEIDMRLHDNIGHRDHGVLHAGRHADADDMLYRGEVQADFFEINAVILPDPHQVNEAERSADELGQHRRKGGAADAHAQHTDEEQIQDHICDRGYNQIIQRVPGIPCRTHDAGEAVVKNKADGAGIINTKIDQ